MENYNDLVIYQTEHGSLELRADVSADTVWASQAQIAEAFGVDVRTISEHIGNIVSTKELPKSSTIRKFRIVRLEGKRQVERQIDHYNLDMILSVGYRVNSKKATQFRKWATEVLKKHIVEGYTINELRLGQLNSGINDVHRALEIARQTIDKQENKDLANEVLSMLERYTHSLTLLQSFDEQNISSPKGKKPTGKITYKECLHVIDELRNNLIARDEATALFGNEREHGLDQVIGSIYQTFGGSIYTQQSKIKLHIYCI
ncbi:MAG: virulence RhuM family protein [Acidimicrobiia bacterium]|nr:virulence RhuM family protein [Acidimicrobiia bacterium]